jgi:Na+/phosphate symporter
MHDEGLLEDHGLAVRRPARPSQPRLVVLAAVLTALISASVCVAAILARAPAVAIPLVVAICVGCPMFAGWEVPNALAAIRANRGRKALARLRRSLDRLPETEHPLGF